MIVTIMSDASFCPDTKSSGYGIWIKSNRGLKKNGGNFKDRTISVKHAEAKALAIAVWSAFKYKIAYQDDRLILQTDNLDNVGLLKRSVLETTKANEPLIYIKNIIKDNNCTYDVRHVKAHKPSLGGRNYINDICDKYAGQAMRRERKLKYGI